MFPHDVLPNEDVLFTDGRVRIVKFNKLIVLGRIDRAQFAGGPKKVT